MEQILNLNCFEKTKVRWGIFKKLSPTKLHSEQVAPLAANGLVLGEGWALEYKCLN
jgi:hypothetical protein